jgi:hypothetical protein
LRGTLDKRLAAAQEGVILRALGFGQSVEVEKIFVGGEFFVSV